MSAREHPAAKRYGFEDHLLCKPPADWEHGALTPGGHGESFSAARHAPTAAQDLLDLARLLLTPGARLSDEDDGLSDEWVKGRIRWHRLDGNDELADEMLSKENSIRRAIGKEPLDV